MFSPIYAARISRIVAVNESELDALAKRKVANQKAADWSGAMAAPIDRKAQPYAEEWLHNLP